jgi:hypothetical protein
VSSHWPKTGRPLHAGSRPGGYALPRRRIAGIFTLALVATLLLQTPARAGTLVAQDDFASGNYSGGSGWTGNWTETGDDGSSGSGDVRLSGGALLFDDNGGNSIERQVDLATPAGLEAILRFTFQVTDLEAGELAFVDVSNNGGTTWTQLASFTDNNSGGTVSGSSSADITAFIASNTRVRFRNNSWSGSSSDQFSADNIQIIKYPALTPPPVGTATYWINGAEEQIFDIYANNDNDPNLVKGQGSHTAIGVAAWGDGITVCYDHWEDGYDADVTNTTTCDELFNLNESDDLLLENGGIPIPRLAVVNCPAVNPSSGGCYYDGRDRILVTGGPVAVSRAFWPESIQTVYADAWEVYPETHTSSCRRRWTEHPSRSTTRAREHRPT